MRTIGVYEAKTQFSRLLDAVSERGERIVITRNGVSIAELRPIEPTRVSPDDLAERFRAFQRKQSKKPGALREPGETLRDLAHVGHRR